MSTRSNTHIYIDGKRSLSFYRHCDGYPEGHGMQMAKMMNAQFDVSMLVKEMIMNGNAEIEQIGTEHSDIDYLYRVYYKTPESSYYPQPYKIKVERPKCAVRQDGFVFDGTPDQFISWFSNVE